MQSEFDRLLEELDRELGKLKSNRPELFWTPEQRLEAALASFTKAWGYATSEFQEFATRLLYNQAWPSSLGLDLSGTAARRADLYYRLYPEALESKLERWPAINGAYARFINWLSDRWPERFLPGGNHE